MQWLVEEALMLRRDLDERRQDEQAENARRVAEAQAKVAADLAAGAR